jgi:hypothetical protein
MNAGESNRDPYLTKFQQSRTVPALEPFIVPVGMRKEAVPRGYIKVLQSGIN